MSALQDFCHNHKTSVFTSWKVVWLCRASSSIIHKVTGALGAFIAHFCKNQIDLCQWHQTLKMPCINSWNQIYTARITSNISGFCGRRWRIDAKLLLQNGFQPYFQLGPLSEILTIAYLACCDQDFNLCRTQVQILWNEVLQWW